MEFSAVSFDIFQTLADIHPRIPAVWQGILKENFSEALAERGAELLARSLPEGFREAAAEFIPMQEFFRKRMEKVLTELNISIDPGEAADVFRREHSRAVVYPDAPECLRWVGSRMTVCIASDADREMAAPFLNLLPEGKVFLSEEIRAYKQDLQGRFFSCLLRETGITPEKILHVGDSAADILGARRAGIKVCLLERNGRRDMAGIPEPDFRISTLTQLPELLSDIEN